MAYAEATVWVARTVPEVFQFVLDGENNKLWRSAVLDVERVLGNPIGVGTVFIQTIKGPNGMKIKADYEMVELKQDQLMVFQVLNGPYRAIGTFSFEPEERGTKLTFAMSETSGESDPLRNNHLQNVVNAITDLKDYLEAGK